LFIKTGIILNFCWDTKTKGEKKEKERGKKPKKETQKQAKEARSLMRI